MILTGLVITAASGLAIAIIGLLYLCAPRTAAPTFGLPSVPGVQHTAWLRIKGVRDAACGVAAAALLATAPPAAIGWCLLAFALIPAGDAATILASRGRPAAAWGIHVPTALVMIAGAILLLVGAR